MPMMDYVIGINYTNSMIDDGLGTFNKGGGDERVSLVSDFYYETYKVWTDSHYVLY